jgi:DNA-binding CsgD family transcriptional regulator
MSRRPSHYRRRAVNRLTQRQRDVLELVARGHTNAQVAEELGISLDGAKFHVREILSRLDVATREEAVEVWQARERLSGLRHLVAALHLRPIAYGGAATALAVATIVVILALFAARDDEDAWVSGPGIYLAVVQPAPNSDAYRAGWTAPLRVLEVTTGREKSFGPPAVYIDLEWAPDGSRLAALGLVDLQAEELDLRLRIWDRRGRLLQDFRLPPLRFTESVAWSPDSSRIALLGQGIMMLDAGATELGWFPAPPFAGGGGSSQGAPSHPWSSDSQFVATVGNRLLLIADRQGDGSIHELPPRFQGSVLGWAETRLHLWSSDSSGQTERFGTLANGALTWTDPEPAQGDPFGFPDQATVDELNALVPGRSFAGVRPLYGGQQIEAFVLNARPDPGAPNFDPFEPRPVSLAIRHAGDQSVVDLGPVWGQQMGIDMVAVPGGDYRLPTSLDAATPLPDYPTATPRPASTQAFVTAVPVTPRPYPTPVGSLVVSQVAGLPVFPGAQEVDGFHRAANSFSDVEESVQVYATSASELEVLDFYKEALVADGFTLSSSGGGANGQQLTLVRGKDSVRVATTYIPRPDDPYADEYPPYGYLGNKQWNLEFEPGMRYFFVVTLRAQDP